MVETSLEQFLGWGATRPVTPVIRRLFADSETPMGLYRKLSRGPGSFLLESADQAGKWSRYSFLGVATHGVLTQETDKAVWRSHGMSSEVAFGGEIPQNSLDALQQIHRRWLSEPIEGL
ncbi:MAG: anthranilate synthase component I, partial [Pontimonas sp.]